MTKAIKIISADQTDYESPEYEESRRSKAIFAARKRDCHMEMRPSCGRILLPLLELDSSVSTYGACPTRFRYALGGREHVFVPDMKVEDGSGGYYAHVVDEGDAEDWNLPDVVRALAAQGIRVHLVPDRASDTLQVRAALEMFRYEESDVDERTKGFLEGTVAGEATLTVGQVVGRLMSWGHDGLQGGKGGLPEIRARIAVMTQAQRGVISMGLPRRPVPGRRGFVSLLSPGKGSRDLHGLFEWMDAAPVGRAGVHGAEWSVVALARSLSCDASIEPDTHQGAPTPGR